ncbi:MAG: hypothetical protein AB7V04_14465 [Desulfomonilaceae bacterium]
MFGQFQEVYELAKPYLNTRNNDIHMKVSYAFCSKLLGTQIDEWFITDTGIKLAREELESRFAGLLED